MATKQISISKFKAECGRYLESLDPEGFEITKYGTVIARVLPVEQHSASLIGCLKGRGKSGTGKRKGGLFSTGVRWDAQT